MRIKEPELVVSTLSHQGGDQENSRNEGRVVRSQVKHGSHTCLSVGPSLAPEV